MTWAVRIDTRVVELCTGPDHAAERAAALGHGARPINLAQVIGLVSSWASGKHLAPLVHGRNPTVRQERAKAHVIRARAALTPES